MDHPSIKSIAGNTENRNHFDFQPVGTEYVKDIFHD